LVDAVKYRLSHAAGGIGIVLVDELDSGFKLVGRFGCPPNALTVQTAGRCALPRRRAPPPPSLAPLGGSKLQ
jgi:hypothetical protein